MSISKSAWVSDVRDALLAMGKDVSPDTIEGGLNYCLQQLADIAVADVKIRARLQQTFTLTLASGVTTLPTTLLTSPNAFGAYVVTGTGTYPWEYLPNGNDRFNPPPFADFTYYVIHNNQLTAFDYQGTVTTETSATLKGNFVPLITEVPQTLEDELVFIGIQWANAVLEQESTAA